MTRLEGMSKKSLALVAFFYQGGMTLYYLRRRRPVAQALALEAPDGIV